MKKSLKYLDYNVFENDIKNRHGNSSDDNEDGSNYSQSYKPTFQITATFSHFIVKANTITLQKLLKKQINLFY